MKKMCRDPRLPQAGEEPGTIIEGTSAQLHEFDLSLKLTPNL